MMRLHAYPSINVLRLSFVLLCILQLLLLNRAYAQSFPAYGVIYNSTTSASQTIALGVNPEGHLNTPTGFTLNAGKNGSVGIAYKWSAGGYGKGGKYYSPGWYDATSPGCLCEGWGASATDSRNTAAYGYASVDNGGIRNVTVKSFVVDTTSIKSTVWINDSSGVPMLEVTHIYGPTSGPTMNQLFQSLVTITNISGGTLRDVRYQRAMDWDIPHNEFSEYVDHYGVAASLASPNFPKIWNACDNGFATPNPTVTCSPIMNNSVNRDFTNLGPSDHGSSFVFQFGDLPCNESATFYIYYGSSGDKASLLDALKQVGSSVYSIGTESYTTVSYGFGFKGVSGSAVAPTLPTKTASLPAGSNTKPEILQTYAPPVVSGSYIYQSLFQFQKDKQWIGEIKRYNLDASGAITSDPPLMAKTKLLARASQNGPYSAGGRSIWTVGYDPACMSAPVSQDASNNTFTLTNNAQLVNLLFNCPATPNLSASSDLINFVRGLNTYWEENSPVGAVRSSVLGDTYHSEMVLVGAPNAPWSSDFNTFGKSEAYYRYVNGYMKFTTDQGSRRPQIYIGANDGMLHAFDSDLNERWAFIPPSVVPMLRNMTGIKGTSSGNGKSNSVFSVDGPITVKDVYFYGEAKWKTVLMGGLGWGGNSYYALDITDPDHPAHLFTVNNDVNNKVINYWDASGKKSTFNYSASCTNFDFSKLGGAWSRPVIMLLPYTEGTQNQRWVALFGGGFAGGASTTGASGASTFGSYVYALELEPDSGKSTSSCGASDASSVVSTGGHVLGIIPVGNDSKSDIPNGVTAHLTVIAGDGTSLANYYGGISYFTDLQGKLWKMNLSKLNLTDSNATIFTLNESFRDEATLANDRMAYNQLASTIVSGVNQTGMPVSRLFNYFGSGDMTRVQRRVPTINNRIYGVSDSDFPSPNLTLTDQTVSTFTNVDVAQCNVNNSWYTNVYAKTGIASNADYQKIIGRAAVFNKYVYVSAYRPEDASCPLYGTSRLIEITDTCAAGNAGALLGPGLATSPVIDSKGNIYIGVSNLPTGNTVTAGRDNLAKLTVSNPTPAGKIQPRSWREIKGH